MEFPRHLHKPGGYYVEVIDKPQYDAVKAAGWTDVPEAHVEVPKEVRFADALNNTPIDFDETVPPAETPTPEKPKRGRKPKAQ